MSRHRWVTAVLLIAGLVAMAMGASPALAQDDTENSDLGKIQILNVASDDEDVVTLDLAIPGSLGELTPSESNFGLAVNGQLVNEFSVSPVSTAIDVIVVIDTSGSMNGGALAAAKQAATSFVDQLPPDSRVGVIGFGETATVFNPPTSDRDTVRANIAGLEAAGETALWDGLVEAAAMASESTNALPYIIVLSDGANTVGTADQVDAVTSIDDADAGLYAIFIDSAEADGSALQESVEALNGIYTTAAGSDGLTGLYQDIADRLSSRYQITFARPDRNQAQVIVSVAIEDAAVATARTRLDAIDDSAVDDADAPARVLNVPVESQLGAVRAPDPGWIGQPFMLPIGVAAMFLAMVLVGVLILNPAMDVRLEAVNRADKMAGFNDRVAGLVDGIVARRDQEGELDKALDAANVNLRPGEFVLASFVIVLAAALAGWLAGGIIAGAALAAIAAISTLAYLNFRANRQRKLFADQLTDTLGMMGGSLRAGRGLPQAIELVADEALPPTSEQFRRVVFETQVGRDLTESLQSVARRMKSQDFEWVAKAVDINRELGGDLTELLDNVADTIRERRRISRMVQSLSAEGRASGWVMISLPVLMLFFVRWRTPENFDLLVNTGLGRAMLAGAAFGMLVGYLWIRKLVDLKY